MKDKNKSFENECLVAETMIIIVRIQEKTVGVYWLGDKKKIGSTGDLSVSTEVIEAPQAIHYCLVIIIERFRL